MASTFKVNVVLRITIDSITISFFFNIHQQFIQKPPVTISLGSPGESAKGSLF